MKRTTTASPPKSPKKPNNGRPANAGRSVMDMLARRTGGHAIPTAQEIADLLGEASDGRDLKAWKNLPATIEWPELAKALAMLREGQKETGPFDRLVRRYVTEKQLNYSDYSDAMFALLEQKASNTSPPQPSVTVSNNTRQPGAGQAEPAARTVVNVAATDASPSDSRQSPSLPSPRPGESAYVTKIRNILQDAPPGTLSGPDEVLLRTLITPLPARVKPDLDGEGQEEGADAHLEEVPDADKARKVQDVMRLLHLIEVPEPAPEPAESLVTLWNGTVIDLDALSARVAKMNDAEYAEFRKGLEAEADRVEPGWRKDPEPVPVAQDGNSPTVTKRTVTNVASGGPPPVPPLDLSTLTDPAKAQKPADEINILDSPISVPGEDPQTDSEKSPAKADGQPRNVPGQVPENKAMGADSVARPSDEPPAGEPQQTPPADEPGSVPPVTSQPVAAQSPSPEITRLMAKLAGSRSSHYTTLGALNGSNAALPPFRQRLWAQTAGALAKFETTLLNTPPVEHLPDPEPPEIVELLIAHLITIGPEHLAPDALAQKTANLKQEIGRTLSQIYNRRLPEDAFEALWAGLWQGTDTLRTGLTQYTKLMGAIRAAAGGPMAKMGDAARARMIALVGGGKVHSLQDLNNGCVELAESTRAHLKALRPAPLGPQWATNWLGALQKDGFEISIGDGKTNLGDVIKGMNETNPAFKMGYEYQVFKTLEARSSYTLIKVEDPYEGNRRADSLEVVKVEKDGTLVKRFREYKYYDVNSNPKKDEKPRKTFRRQLEGYADVLDKDRGRDLEYVFKSQPPKWAMDDLKEYAPRFGGRLWVSGGELELEKVEVTPTARRYGPMGKTPVTSQFVAPVVQGNPDAKQFNAPAKSLHTGTTFNQAPNLFNASTTQFNAGRGAIIRINNAGPPQGSSVQRKPMPAPQQHIQAQGPPSRGSGGPPAIVPPFSGAGRGGPPAKKK
ncbi:hypothetical protein [Sphaerisporangium rhizosphaerae]|uniref:Uncharacterized protein n=1 Tax=Sphaerisporangium rhizosphaerae TaxID=2269375 RepID=A0ABW2P666_9ACTN